MTHLRFGEEINGEAEQLKSPNRSELRSYHQIPSSLNNDSVQVQRKGIRSNADLGHLESTAQRGPQNLRYLGQGSREVFLDLKLNFGCKSVKLIWIRAINGESKT